MLSYGVPKSGSTLAFQLARAAARLGGHRQAMPALLSRAHRVNFLQTLHASELPALAAAAADRVVLVKTHASPDAAWVEAYVGLAERGLVSAHVNHRDPRDVCLSLLDAGVLARTRRSAAFAEFVTMADAEARVERYLAELAIWAGLPRVLPLRYEICAFRTDAAIDSIKAHLGVRCPNWPVRLYAQHIAFTWRNKAIPARHEAELDTATRARLTARFAPYLRQMGYAEGVASTR